MDLRQAHFPLLDRHFRASRAEQSHHHRLNHERSRLDVAGRPSPTCAGKRGARFVVIALAAYLLWSGRTSSSMRRTSTPIRRSSSPMVLAPALLIRAAARAKEMT